MNRPAQIFLKNGNPIDLGSDATGINSYHVFEQEDIDAVNAALAARRPLLIRGEPGVGKSQLAKAAANVLGWAFCSKVVDARTESRDLKWTEDLVARLADAQIAGMRHHDDCTETLPLINYISPGPLWWAFDWESASKLRLASVPSQHHGGSHGTGVVLLIDEIDKAESELPNGLLDALGSRRFTTPVNTNPVVAKNWPLVIVTSNDERRLPDAFIRRCVVHHMKLPTGREALVEYLVARGKAHFPDLTPELLQEAAEMTATDRSNCEKIRLRPLPGQAEYIDLLRAVSESTDPGETLKRLARYFLRKHPELEK